MHRWLGGLGGEQRRWCTAVVDGSATSGGTYISARDTIDQVVAARTKGKVTPKYKTKYRVKNWPAYEAALRKCGDVTLWFDDDAIDAWSAGPSGRAATAR